MNRNGLAWFTVGISFGFLGGLSLRNTVGDVATTEVVITGNTADERSWRAWEESERQRNNAAVWAKAQRIEHGEFRPKSDVVTAGTP